MKKVFVRDPFNYDADEASLKSGFECVEPTLAQQQFLEETDINEIVRRFGVTGQVPVTMRMPMAEDFVGITDYHTAMNAVRAGQESFDALPAELRERFENDPGKFVEFCLDPKNKDEAVELGLAVPSPVVSPTPQERPEGAAQ